MKPITANMNTDGMVGGWHKGERDELGSVLLRQDRVVSNRLQAFLSVWS